MDSAAQDWHSKWGHICARRKEVLRENTELHCTATISESRDYRVRGWYLRIWETSSSPSWRAGPECATIEELPSQQKDKNKKLGLNLLKGLPAPFRILQARVKRGHGSWWVLLDTEDPKELVEPRAESPYSSFHRILSMCLQCSCVTKKHFTCIWGICLIF